MGFYGPVENFSLVLRCQHYQWSASNFDLYLAFDIAVEQWGFLSMPHRCDTGHLFIMVISGPVTFIPLAKCLAMELSLPVITSLSRLGFEHPTFCVCLECWGWCNPKKQYTSALFCVYFNSELTVKNVIYMRTWKQVFNIKLLWRHSTAYIPLHNCVRFMRIITMSVLHNSMQGICLNQLSDCSGENLRG